MVVGVVVTVVAIKWEQFDESRDSNGGSFRNISGSNCLSEVKAAAVVASGME